ncbi:MAG: hypothetical protein AAF513_16965 [Pseudomonadota bacterium]
MNQFVRIYLLPGAMLQSVIVAGGYGTGREVVEYFTGRGLTDGILGIGIAAVVLALVFVLSLEVVRVFKVYDYRNFFKVLLGRGWFLYEILVLLLILLVLAVIGSAAGEILQNELGIPRLAGAAVMLFAVTIIVFFGRELVMRLLAYWSLYLYLVFGAYLVAVLMMLGDDIVHGFANAQNEGGWFTHGAQYTFYNMTAIPVILYCAAAIQNRRQAIVAGITGALIAILPGLMLHISFAGFYPEILGEPLPIYAVFAVLDLTVLKLAYLFMLFGTFIETGAGDLQGIIERLDAWRRERLGYGFSSWFHAGVALLAMCLAGALSFVGIVDLIAEGYGTLAWGFLAVYALPLFTVGIYKLYRQGNVEGPDKLR